MKTMSLVAIVVVLLTVCRMGQAVEPPKFLSATFQDILSRVVRRDVDSGAILSVKAKEDASTLRLDLQFKIEETLHQNEVVVVIWKNMKTNDGVYEMYRLKMDDAIQQELRNQKRFQELQKERQKKALEERAKKIEQLTEGKLKYGMMANEVEAIKGKPLVVEKVNGGGAAGIPPETFIWVYPNLKLHFYGGMLTDAERNN